jgi:hypothetical protein
MNLFRALWTHWNPTLLAFVPCTSFAVLIRSSGCIIMLIFVLMMPIASCSHLNNLLLFQGCHILPHQLPTADSSAVTHLSSVLTHWKLSVISPTTWTSFVAAPKPPSTLRKMAISLNYTFKFGINCPVAVILCTFNCKSGKKKRFSIINSYLLCCLHVCLLFSGFKVVPAEWGRVSYRCQDCVVTNDLWCEFEVPSSTHLLSHCVGVALWIYCELM